MGVETEGGNTSVSAQGYRCRTRESVHHCVGEGLLYTEVRTPGSDHVSGTGVGLSTREDFTPEWVKRSG